MDGFANVITGIGTYTNDKRTHGVFQGCPLPYSVISQMWERSTLTAKVIEAPADECFREGYELEFPDESTYKGLKEELENEMRDVGAIWTLKRADQIRRAFGGAVAVLGVNDGGRTLDQPLDESNVNAFTHMNVLEPIEIVPARMQMDLSLPGYGEPDLFMLTGAEPLAASLTPAPIMRPVAQSSGVFIHRSRLLIFRGIRASRIYYDSQRDVDLFWGGSVVPRFAEALRDYDTGHSATALLMNEASMSIYSRDGLLEAIVRNEAAVIDRARALKMAQSVARMNLLDGKTEKLERLQVQFGNMPEVLDRLSQRLAGEGDVSLSVLIGYSPASLGSPDKDELKIWHNKCRIRQTDEFEPHVRRITDLKMKELRTYKRPKNYTVCWKDLDPGITAQRVEMELNVSRKDTLDIKNGTVWSQEVRDSRYGGGYSTKTQLDPKKKAPGFLAPLPQGVLPKAMSATAAIESEEAGNKPGATGAGAVAAGGHTVTGYVRKNPAAQTGTVKVGGAAAPGQRADDDTSGGPYAMSSGWADLIGVRRVKRSKRNDYAAGEQVVFAGLPVVIENPRGSTRTWVDTDGTTGTTTMKYDYGEIVGTMGPDGDAIDIYLGDNENVPDVYLMHQLSKSSNFQAFDEMKIMVGFDSAQHAIDAYLTQYDDPRFLGEVEVMPIDTLRRQVPAGIHTDPDVEAILAS